MHSPATFDQILASVFRRAIGEGDADQVIRCIKDGAVVNPVESCLPPLFLAVLSASSDIVDILLRSGAKVNIQVKQSEFGTSCAIRVPFGLGWAARVHI